MLPSATTPIPTTPRTPLTYGDPQNTLARPEGQEYQLPLGEGMYTLRDVITLGSIPPPPSDNPGAPTNVLDPKPLPLTAAPRVSIVNLVDHRLSSHTGDTFAFATESPFAEEGAQKKVGASNGTSRLTHLTSGNLRGYVRGTVGPASSNQKAQSSRDSKELPKRKKPKASILKSNSSMIARVNAHDGLSKRLQERKPEGHFAFTNNGRALLWLDLSSSNKAQQLIKILFTRSHPLCHDVNAHTKSSAHLDVVVGFSTPDIFWYEPISQKYTHLNKNGIIHALPVSDIRWHPLHENLFVAAHVDGTLVFYDKEKDDAPLVTEEPAELEPTASTESKRNPKIEIRRSLHGAPAKTNPVAIYRVTPQRINSIEFSSDGRFLAIVSEDGSLRVIDLDREELIDLYSSYYGGVNCVCWSPDNKYILTGSQDDLVSIWSFEERTLVARCQGHRSWVTWVAFDRWRCDESNYRFASVGDDRRLLLWDFSTGLVQRPRAASLRPSVVSLARPESAMASRTSLIRSIESPKLTREGETEDDTRIVHAIEKRAEVATLPPVLTKQIDEHPLSWVGFTEDAIIVSCSSGHIHTFDRPQAAATSEGDSTGSTVSNPSK